MLSVIMLSVAPTVTEVNSDNWRDRKCSLAQAISVVNSDSWLSEKQIVVISNMEHAQFNQKTLSYIVKDYLVKHTGHLTIIQNRAWLS